MAAIVSFDFCQWERIQIVTPFHSKNESSLDTAQKYGQSHNSHLYPGSQYRCINKNINNNIWGTVNNFQYNARHPVTCGADDCAKTTADPPKIGQILNINWCSWSTTQYLKWQHNIGWKEDNGLGLGLYLGLICVDLGLDLGLLCQNMACELQRWRCPTSEWSNPKWTKSSESKGENSNPDLSPRGAF